MPDLSWELFERQVAQCQMCGLCQNIHHKVPGQGDRHSPLMLIGEGPGQVEDEEGLAFVGPAGQLLTKMLAAISLPRDRVYICNVVKCRPPQNRVPTDEEAAACKLHLRIQTALIRPKSSSCSAQPPRRTSLGRMSASLATAASGSSAKASG